MTSLKELYDIFLPKIADYKLLQMTDEQIKEDLYGYFQTARAFFYRCKNDLSDDGVNILSDLTYFEKEILVSLMLVDYITPKLLSSENLSQSLSDKDFKIYSQANHLREIRLLMEYLQRKANRLITEYTYFDLEEEKM